jgi:hypothetical protein
MYDMTACQKIDGFGGEPYQSFDAYTQTSGEPICYVGGGLAANVATRPY